MNYQHDMPTDVLREVYPADVLDKLKRKARSGGSEELVRRINVLEASGPTPSDRIIDDKIQRWRKVKASWDAYRTAGFAVGLFHGDDGRDLKAKLRSPDAAPFRGAMAECLAAWYFAKRRGLKVEVRPKSPGRGTLDLCVCLGEDLCHIEVKAPYREMPPQFCWGDDSDLLRSAMESANRQFSDSVLNILAIVPQLRLGVFEHRNQLTRAFFGEEMISIPIDQRTGGPAGPERVVFEPSGHFLSTTTPRGTPYKLDNSPRFTRVSGILVIEEIVGVLGIDHQCLMVHNPYESKPLQKDLFSDLPQFVRVEDSMLWTDRAPAFP